MEPRATNTGENITLTRRVLDLKDIHPRSITLITRPYQQRRAYATARKLWPEVEINASAQALDFSDYLTEIGDSERVLNMLVGDTQRIWVHADNGYAIDQEVPERVVQAYERLRDAGFTQRLI